MNPGRVTGNIRKRSVTGALKKSGTETGNGAETGEGCAIFSPFEDGVACHTQAAALGEDCIGISQLLQRSVNGLAAMGATAFAATATALIPVGFEESELKRMMTQFGDAAVGLGIGTVKAQASVLEAVKSPVVTVTSSGSLRGHHDYSFGSVEPGQSIVLTKWIGLEGTAILARRWESRLRERLPDYLVREAASFDRYLDVRKEAEIAEEFGVAAMYNVAEGGILAALWELGEQGGVGMEVALKKIPLRQETVEVCECLEGNPYELMSGGCLLLTASDGQGLVRALEDRGIPATEIGRTTGGNDRVVINEDEIRYLNRPGPDAIYACAIT